MSDSRPRGRPSWVTGSKLKFLTQFSDEWQRAKDQGPNAVGVFYTNVTKRFVSQYGWHFNRWEDKICKPADDDDAWVNITDHGDLDQEEITCRRQYFQDLRAVSGPTRTCTCPRLTDYIVCCRKSLHGS